MRPPNLIYGLEDRPPLWANFVLGFQHVSLVAISLILPVFIVRHAGGGPEQATFMVSMSMLAAGLSVVIQAFRAGPVGSGYLCPALCGPSYLSASLLASSVGGLPLVLGMTMFAGLVEAAFSRVLHRLRALFPAEVTGTIVSMVGITVVKIAGQNFLGLGPDGRVSVVELGLAAFTLACMVGLNVWTRGKLRLACIVIGMALGYAASYAAGVLTPADMAVLGREPLVWFPLTRHPGLAFDLALAGPFAIAVLCSTFKSVGDLTTCQRINDVHWKRPDMHNVRRGLLAEAIGSAASGALGGMGQSTSSSNIGLSIATASTSRSIALPTGIILAVLAFCPKLASIFAIMPRPVMGATLIFSLGFMIVAGIQIIMSRMLDSRKTFVIGLSIIFGLMVDLLPAAFADAPHWLRPVVSSSLSAATVCAVLLNLVFRIGIRTRAEIELLPGEHFSEKIFAFMDSCGRAWGARPEVVKRAAGAMTEFMEAAAHALDVSGPVRMQAAFDEFNLDVAVRYQGPALPLPLKRPDMAEVLEEPMASAALAGFLIKGLADRVVQSEDAAGRLLRIHYDH
ncbi:MAG: hypothetical protein JW718_03445 [Desulfovibrionaceae bacterium]|nr:hypothetical protein [Desulfovibrionaceae bacterium]